MLAAAADCCSATKNRKSSNLLHCTCLPVPHVDLKQILQPSECDFRIGFENLGKRSRLEVGF